MLQLQTNASSAQPSAPAALPALPLGRIVLSGLLVLVAFFGTVGVWASFAPLQSAAIAPGLVSVADKRKSVQHLEGGMVDEIHVREGDVVAAGDDLITLHSTRAQKELALTQIRLLDARARVNRYEAELLGSPDITWDDIDEAAILPDLHQSKFDLTSVQMRLRNDFFEKKTQLEDTIADTQQRSAKLEEEKSGIRGQIASQNQQIELLEDEIASMKRLFDKGLTGKTRLRQFQRDLVDIKGRKSQNLAAISRIDQSILQTQIELDNFRNDRRNAVTAKLQELEAEIRELEQLEPDAADVLRRTKIIAPIGGRVLGLQVFTQNAVVMSGETLLEIVPQDDGLVVEARVDPIDIDVVHEGLDAMVRFVSFNQRNTTPTPARVVNVSGDSLTDERSGGTYYSARVELTEEGRAALDQAITPGMPVEVLIVTGERTPLEYFLQPITRSFFRAFRES